MQKFNIIEIAAIVSKHDYLSIGISRIDEVYNPYIICKKCKHYVVIRYAQNVKVQVIE